MSNFEESEFQGKVVAITGAGNGLGRSHAHEFAKRGAKVLVKAMITNRVGTGVAFMPFHFGGHFQGKDLRSKYPKGADPIVLGESSNTAQTYGYDSVTQMQETKATLCKIMPA